MTWTDLGNPAPHNTPVHYIPHSWDVQENVMLEVPEQLPEVSLATLLTQRRTYRDFNALSIEALGHLLWITSRQVNTGHSEYGFPITQRPIPSAGAIHPIHILFTNKSVDFWWRYDPLAHCLQALDSSSHQALQQSNLVLDCQQGYLMMFVAEPGKTAAKYRNPESLIWRDAGVIIGNFALATEAMNLSFCPLGITGEPWASKLSEKGLLKGVGMAVVGSK